MEPSPFIALLLITGLALIVPILLGRFRRLQLPIVVGEIPVSYTHLRAHET